MDDAKAMNGVPFAMPRLFRDQRLGESPTKDRWQSEEQCGSWAKTSKANSGLRITVGAVSTEMTACSRG
jgi:hypothetical protein